MAVFSGQVIVYGRSGNSSAFFVAPRRNKKGGFLEVRNPPLRSQRGAIGATLKERVIEGGPAAATAGLLVARLLRTPFAVPILPSASVARSPDGLELGGQRDHNVAVCLSDGHSNRLLDFGLAVSDGLHLEAFQQPLFCHFFLLIRNGFTVVAVLPGGRIRSLNVHEEPATNSSFSIFSALKMFQS
jgi:hypothetical protein